MSWPSRLWRWLCKYGWLVLILAFLPVLCIFGLGRRPYASWAGWRDEYDQAKREVEQDAKDREEMAIDRHEIRLAEIEDEYLETINALDEDQRKRWEEMRDNPRKLANWLRRRARERVDAGSG